MWALGLKNMARDPRGMSWNKIGKEGAGSAFQGERTARAKALRSKGCCSGN